MKYTRLYRFIYFLGILFTFNSCVDDFSPPPLKTIDFKNDSQTKVKQPIKTEYNPVVLDRYCKEKSTIKIHIPEPYPYNAKKKQRAKDRGDEAHLVEIMLDSVRIESTYIGYDFFDTGEAWSGKYYKIIECDMPVFSNNINSSGTITINLFSEEELVTSYHTNYHYLDRNEKMKVIKRRDDTRHRYPGPVEVSTNDPIITLTKPGAYINDITYTTLLKKQEDHYLSSTTLTGNAIYRKANKDSKWSRWKKEITLPQLPAVTAEIPLEFELEEMEKSYNKSGNIMTINKGIKLFFDSYYLDLGKSMEVQFNNCEMEISNEKQISIPNINPLSGDYRKEK